MKNVTTRHLRLFGSLNQTKLTPDCVQWASLMFSTATQIFKELYLLEQVKRIELSPTAWQAVVLTVILHLHFEAFCAKRFADGFRFTNNPWLYCAVERYILRQTNCEFVHDIMFTPIALSAKSCSSCEAAPN